jgi:hypothetical protein
MGAYAEAYLSDVVENQGKLFDYVAETFPDKDTEDFINFYMQSNTPPKTGVTILFCVPWYKIILPIR